MDISKIVADAKAKADANGDGKLSIDDIQEVSRSHTIDSDVIDSLKDTADSNNDGRVDFEDVRNSIEDFGDMLGNAGRNIGNTIDDISGRMFGGNK